ncbi:MAG: excinuclease ABC subunit UvrC [Actinomycetota bacterium]|nr:excinuclease ABC subunit UvrC [Actinomycetota bacterium]
MTDPSSYRPESGTIPTGPGVYRFRDHLGRVIYVGKARSLRSRVNSYFADFATLHPRTQSMVTAASSVDWVVVANEVEALALEFTWIKEYDPRFNVKYRDDKSYPYLAITVGEQFPRAAVVREPRRKGTRYFGPYAHAWAIRETLDELSKVFGVRTCRDGVFKRAAQLGRPCLLGYIDKCSAPCVGRIDEDGYRERVDDMCKFLAGNTRPFIKQLESAMDDAAARQEYEEAARLRDRLGALRRAMERNAVVLDDGTDADVVALHDDALEIGVQVFHVRSGRLVGERSFIVEKAEDISLGGYVERVLQRLYSGREGVEIDSARPPREVLVSAEPDDGAAVGGWLEERRGGPVDIRIPQRGDKRALMETAVNNAREALNRHRLKRSSDLTARSEALAELQDYLHLNEAPLRIECIDISTLQGTDTVASLVVFEDGLPRKADYRSFIIKTPRADDLAAVREVVERRFAHKSTTEERRTFAYPPGLLVIDGGAPQVAAAQQALTDVGAGDIPVVGLAKRLEEVWPPDSADPIILPRTSEALYLLQRVRDEAHRTAIAFHRKRRSSRQRRSALDDIPGLGEVKAKALLRHFGSVKAIRNATTEELQVVPGIGPTLAATIHQALASASTNSDSPQKEEAHG